MNKVFATSIVADQPTRNGNIYSRQALEAAVKSFNLTAKNHPVPGSVIDRVNIEKIDPITHYTTELFFNDSGILCARINIKDQKLLDRVNSGISISARPIISVPSFELDKSRYEYLISTRSYGSNWSVMMNLNEAKVQIKRAGIMNVRVVPMPGQSFDGDHQIEVKTGSSWNCVASGFKKSMAESLVREATSRVILG